jgi:capsule polysaccharide export protein KpsE/RkpR
MEDSKFEDLRATFEDNLEISLEPEGNFTIKIYDKDKQNAVNMAKDYFEIANNIAQDLFQKESKANREFLEQRIRYTDSTLRVLSDSLIKYSKLHSIISPEDQAKSITSALSNLKAELINQEVMYEIIKNRFGDNDVYTQMQKDIVAELSRKVADAQLKPGFGGNFALTDATKIGLEYMRLYSEIETLTKVKLFLVPLLEEARLNEVRQKQALYVLDEPILADKKARPKRSFIVAGSALGSFILSILFVVLINSYKRFKAEYKKIIG